MIVDVTRTYLELHSPSQLVRADRAAPDVEFVQVRPDVSEYREMYRAVGGPWHWHERNAWSDERLRDQIGSSEVAIWQLRAEGRLGGYFELQRHDDGGVEIVYFGLVSDVFGRGLGASMLTRAVDEAWRMGASRVWLHTCTLDSPRALPNYLARGFVPFRTEEYQEHIPDSAG